MVTHGKYKKNKTTKNPYPYHLANDSYQVICWICSMGRPPTSLSTLLDLGGVTCSSGHTGWQREPSEHLVNFYSINIQSHFQNKIGAIPYSVCNLTNRNYYFEIQPQNSEYYLFTKWDYKKCKHQQQRGKVTCCSATFRSGLWCTYLPPV